MSLFDDAKDSRTDIWRTFDDYYYNNHDLKPSSIRVGAAGERELPAISAYVQQLAAARLDRYINSNAGHVYGIESADSSLRILVYGNDERNVKNFRKFVSALFP
ncbi:MAG: hypothetical protein EOP04_14500 [Proteobacteria bacterium]|nr:MAG: hypothetical protein EOP04_14500 [Pseudomonadota bacterium]